MTTVMPFSRAAITTCIISVLFISGCDTKNEAQKETANPIKPKATISVNEKKANFFAYLHPMIEEVNKEVLSQREILLSMQQELPNLSQQKTEILNEYTHTYRVDKELSTEQQIEKLKRKINTIPASLILAQAANESAWGTSRFARKGNNYFGQWCYSKGCGLVPLGRDDGAKHEVAKFNSPMDSIKSYIRNLNSHPTYETLRELRTQSLTNGEEPSGELLAEGLLGYSIRREEYVKEIQSMIRYNKLSRFDSVTSDKNETSVSGKG
jgi:Bax protein